jgi:hypothetical protein
LRRNFCIAESEDNRIGTCLPLIFVFVFLIEVTQRNGVCCCFIPDLALHHFKQQVPLFELIQLKSKFLIVFFKVITVIIQHNAI